jgi:hypothetical protein
MVKLANIAEIDSGYHFRGRIENDPEGPIAVIQSKDFGDDLRLKVEGVTRVDLEEHPTPSSMVSTGDVLFLSRGNRPWAATVGELPAPAIVPSSFYIVRVNAKRVRPAYLAWFINQPKTQIELRTMMRGTNISFISKLEFQDLRISLPPLEVQDQIVELAQLSEQEQRLLQELGARRKTLIDAVCMDLAEGRGQSTGRQS